MTDKEKHSRLGNLVLGLLVIGMGIFPLLATFDIGPLGTGDINGPPWLGVAAGGIFMVAGLVVMLGESWPLLKNLLGILILAGLAALGNWIAFGVGERVGNSTLSLPIFGNIGLNSDLAYRIPFGFGALVTDAILFYAIVQLIRKSLGDPPKLTRLLKIAEWSVLISISPLLLVLFASLAGRSGIEVIRTRLKTGAWPRNEEFIQRQKLKKK